MTKPADSLSSSAGLVLAPSPSVLTPAPLTRESDSGLSASTSAPFAAAFLAAVFFAATFLVRVGDASTSGRASVAALVLLAAAVLTVFFAAVFLTGAMPAVFVAVFVAFFVAGLAAAFAVFAAVFLVAETVAVERAGVAATARCAVAESRVTWIP